MPRLNLRHASHTPIAFNCSVEVRLFTFQFAARRGILLQQRASWNYSWRAEHPDPRRSGVQRKHLIQQYKSVDVNAESFGLPRRGRHQLQFPGRPAADPVRPEDARPHRRVLRTISGW